MKSSDDIVIGYLCGELSEAEREEVEGQYFTDPQAFDRLVRIENDLIDRYSRGRLSGETRERFERAYLSNKNLRARLKFGEALAEKLDRSEPSPVPTTRGSLWQQSFFSSLKLGKPAFAFSLALVLLLLFGSVWLSIQSNRLRVELARLDAARAEQEQHEAELQQQLADERKRNQELASDLQRASDQATQKKTSPESVTPAFVTLLLTATGVRGAEPTSPPTLVVPKGTEEVHVQLTLKDHDYRNYQVVVQAIAGPQIFNRRNFKPRIDKSGATFIISLPSSKFAAGDYMLTLSGASQSGEFEDVSKSLFRVEKK